MASWLQNISSGNEHRARKEKMMKWVFQTFARDRDWKTRTIKSNRDMLKVQYTPYNCLLKNANYSSKISNKRTQV